MKKIRKLLKRTPSSLTEKEKSTTEVEKLAIGSLTEEGDNFLRIFRLVSNIAPKAVRDKFDHHFPPSSLSSKLTTNRKLIDNLCSLRIINGKQKDLMYPSTGDTSSVNYDVTLMICLLRNLSTISPPSLGYDKLPPATEISDGADLARIKYYRNLIAHPDKDELTTGEFNSMWACVSEAVCRLGGTGYKIKCDDLSQMNLNKDVLIHIRQELTEFRIEMKDQMTSLETDIGKVKHDQTKLKENVANVKVDLSSIKSEQKSFRKKVTVQTTCMQKYIDKVKTDQDTLKEQVAVQSSKTQEQLFSCSCEGIHKLVLKEWKDKEEKFVKTLSSEYVFNILRTENIVTVTGKPGIGKSATIHHNALSLQNGYLKYAIIPCQNPSDIVTHYKAEAYQIFVIDDVCGKYVINQYDVEEWLKYIDYIDKILKEGKTKLLATLRLQVFQETQFKRISIFSRNVCNLSSKAFLLSSNIKLEIAKAYLPENVVMEIGQSLDRYEYLPLLCLLYSQNSNTNALKYFENPFLMYTKELDEMRVQMNKTKLCALFLLVVFDGCIFERTIRDEKFRQTLELIFDSCNVARGTPTDFVINELNTLVGTYLELRVSQKKDEVESNRLAYHAVHDKMFDFLCWYFGGKFQKCMLKFSDDDIICCRMQLKCLDLPKTREAFEILIEKDNEQDYFDRIVDMLRKGKIYDVVCNRQMQNEVYRSKLISHLQLLTNENTKSLLHAQDKNEKTLTFLVCLKGYTDLVQFILERTDDINADHFSTYPPLVGACERGDDIIVQLLISKGANVNKPDDDNQSPLIMALQGCHYSDSHNDSSTSRNYSAIVDLLIENGALVDNLEEFYKCFFIQKNVSPLIGASSLGKLNMVKSFLQRGDSLYATDARKYTPLHWAIYNGHNETAKYLIEKGSNLLITEQDGRNALMLACYSGCTEIVKDLLDEGFQVNDGNARGWTPLLYAINGMGEAGNSVTTVTFLINKGADLDLYNEDGLTPLMLSSKHGIFKITELILEKQINIDINQTDMSGITALMYACLHGHTDICNFLLSKGANVHLVDKMGWTCLMWACYMGSKSTAELLISVGCEINEKDMNGETAILLALKYGIIGEANANINNSAVNVGNAALILAATDSHTDIVDVLITKGADVNAIDEHGKTLLILMIEYGFKDAANLLVAKGADVNAADKNGHTALIIATMLGHTDIVDLLINTGADVNDADENGNTALILATRHGNIDTLDLLINAGADVNADDNNGNTALILATRHGHKDIVALLTRKGADVKAANKNGNTVLNLAASDGRTDYVNVLINKGADINYACKNGNTALILAAWHGHTDTVDLLISKGADKNAADKDGNTALTLATRTVRRDTVDLLIKTGADVNTVDKNGTTALMLAVTTADTHGDYINVFEDQIVIFDLLLSSVRDVNAVDKNGNTALILATRYGHTDTINSLINKGADINDADEDGNTALILAARHGHIDTVDLLINAEADINADDNNGNNALILATRHGHRDTVNLLINKGARVNDADENGNTALILATRHGHKAIASLLINGGADVNAADEDKNTAIMLAMKCGHIDTVDLLTRKGADVKTADKDGKTVLSLAAGGGHKDIADLLITCGADVHANRYGLTALILAARHGHTETVDLLITKGANIKTADEIGRTALMYAAESGRTDTVDFLITKGADINAADIIGRTALILAAGSGHTDTVDAIIAKGADVNAANSHGTSALLLAARAGNTDTVDLLLTKGADLSAADKDGNTALILAEECGNTDTVNLLITKEADIMLLTKKETLV